MKKQVWTILIILAFLVSSLVLFQFVPNVFANNVETRYMISNKYTINTINTYGLNTTQTSSYTSILVIEDTTTYTIYYGIRVYKVSSSGTRTQITSAVSAIASIGTAGGSASGTWNHSSSTSLASTNAIEVEIYAGTSSPPSTLLTAFITEPLGAQSLDACVWTVYYYETRIKTGGIYDYYFWFGSSTYNSRITNFQWTTAPSGYKLNLRVMDWDLTDGISGASVTMNNGTNNVKTSNGNGWANYTSVSGTVTVAVKYFGFTVNGTSITVSADTTKNLQCKLYDVTITVHENLQSAYLVSANVSVFNATSIVGNKIKSGVTGANGQVSLTNLPNNTLTFTLYAGSSYTIVIGNSTHAVSSEDQSITLTANQNYVGTTNTFIIIGMGSIIFLSKKRKYSESLEKAFHCELPQEEKQNNMEQR